MLALARLMWCVLLCAQCQEGNVIIADGGVCVLGGSETLSKGKPLSVLSIPARHVQASGDFGLAGVRRFHFKMQR